MRRPSVPAPRSLAVSLARPSRRRLPLAALIAAALAACASGGPTGAPPAAPSPALADSVRAALAREQRAADGRVTGNAVGVMPFGVAPGDSALAPLAFALADLLTTDLARSRQLMLVERARLGDVLRELDLATAGRVDSSTAPRVGRFIQARQLVVGDLGTQPGARLHDPTPTGTLRLGVRIADVRTGQVAQAVDATAPLADVLAAEKELAFRLFSALGISLTPAERVALEQRPTASLAALLAYGRGLQRQYAGDYRGASDEFRRASRIDPAFRAAGDRAGQARVTADGASSAPITVPGVRPIDAAVTSTVDRINRPLDAITALAKPNTAADPSFPVTTTTIVIVVNRP